MESSERAFWRRGEVSETGSGGSSWRGGFLEGMFVVFLFRDLVGRVLVFFVFVLVCRKDGVR